MALPNHANIDIQMKRKELTKTFMMISNLNKPFGIHGLCKNNLSRVRVKTASHKSRLS